MKLEAVRKKIEAFEKLLDDLGWVVQPHGHFNQNGEAQCACRAGEEYAIQKKKLIDFLYSLLVEV